MGGRGGKGDNVAETNQIGDTDQQLEPDEGLFLAGRLWMLD